MLKRALLIAMIAGLVVPAAAGAHHLRGEWWQDWSLERRLDGQLHLRQTARAALRTLAVHELAARRPTLTTPAERRARHLLAVLRREIPETRQAIADAQAAAEAAATVSYADPETPSSAPAGAGIWIALAECESGGDWSYNGPSGYDGGLQFLPSTWIAAGGREAGYEYAWQAPASVQIAVAQAWLARTSWAQWPACSAKLGLR